MNNRLSELNECRICKGSNIKKNIFSKPFYLSNLNQKIILQYGICIDCQYIFQSNYVGDDFLNKYYHKSPMFRNNDPTIYDVQSINRQIEFVKRNINLAKISSCLEIGAHTGHFLKELDKRYNIKIHYDELSDEALKILNKIKGFNDFRKNSEKVDFIILRHVLEHINDLDMFVEYLNNSLTQKGFIFIEVPDWSILDKHTDAFIFEHLSHFNEKCLIDFFGSKGFRIMAIERSINKNDPATPNRVLRLIFSRDLGPSHGDIKFLNHFNSYYDKKHKFGINNLNKIYSKIGKNKTVAFFPASNLSYTAIIESEINKINFIGYFDSDEKKKGQNYLEFKVFSPNQLKEINPDVIFIFSEAFEPEIRELINSVNIFPKIYSYTKIFSEGEY